MTRGAAWVSVLVCVACSGETSGGESGGSFNSGGTATANGGTKASGGVTAQGGETPAQGFRGGATGSGGTVAQGGSLTHGGTVARGGTTSSTPGGGAAAGGTASSGASTGGVSAEGGTAGSAGEAGAGGATQGTTGDAAGSTSVTTDDGYPISFDQDSEGFVFNTYPSQAPYVNLAATPSTAPSMSWSANCEYVTGKTPKGCLRVGATFSDWNEYLSLEVLAPLTSNGGGIDLTRGTLRAHLLFETAITADSEAPGYLVFYVKSGSSYTWGQAPIHFMSSAGQWITLSFNTESPDAGTSPDWDPSNPVLLGIEVTSGNGDTRPAWTASRNVTFYVDEITFTRN